MDGELITLDRHQHHQLQQVAGTVWADDEPPVRVVAEVVDRKWMVDGVIDVWSTTPCFRADPWILHPA